MTVLSPNHERTKIEARQEFLERAGQDDSPEYFENEQRLDELADILNAQAAKIAAIPAPPADIEFELPSDAQPLYGDDELLFGPATLDKIFEFWQTGGFTETNALACAVALKRKRGSISWIFGAFQELARGTEVMIIRDMVRKAYERNTK